MRRGHQGRTDANHGEIVEALLSVAGVAVHSLAGVGCGCPDLLVGAEGKTYLVEVKDGEKCPSHRTLTPDQKKWIKEWTGERRRHPPERGHGSELGSENRGGTEHLRQSVWTG